MADSIQVVDARPFRVRSEPIVVALKQAEIVAASNVHSPGSLDIFR